MKATVTVNIFYVTAQVMAFHFRAPATAKAVALPAFIFLPAAGTVKRISVSNVLEEFHGKEF